LRYVALGELEEEEVSRLVQWYVANQLRSMDWPRQKDSVAYVPTSLVDIAVEQGLQVCMGLGAGRPALACRLIADIFRYSPWTPEAAAALMADLTQLSDEKVASHAGVAPWQALYADHKMEPAIAEIEWRKLGQRGVVMIWRALGANAAIWGMGHEREVASALAAEKASYEATAPEAVSGDPATAEEFPWQSLDDFYQSCEDIVEAFEQQMTPFPPIPESMRVTGIVWRRLGAPER
jgi:hypothetical protein